MGDFWLALAIGYALGRSMEQWPGGVAASGLGVVLGAVALVSIVRRLRREILG